ncbi:hypothetical protein MAPG_03723 [Magnaporthiopsis poae ATCC 64411]|uniref:Uncharacterized protein n=1 Tax=Magnaporthiopsis poae (strain ATCC 64411 / 73-15) TaxID=644358 RepID=A0A0C4DUT0_MAGP6|nr:hypothetical protein MAPG_03723 [Magnaporthiopsis poae ATCC 64411]
MWKSARWRLLAGESDRCGARPPPSSLAKDRTALSSALNARVQQYGTSRWLDPQDGRSGGGRYVQCKLQDGGWVVHGRSAGSRRLDAKAHRFAASGRLYCPLWWWWWWLGCGLSGWWVCRAEWAAANRRVGQPPGEATPNPLMTSTLLLIR